MEEPSPVRRFDSGELSAGFCFEQLAERGVTASLADFCVWGDVCDALAHFWRSDGFGAGPVEWTANDGDSARGGAFEAVDHGILVRRDGDGLRFLWRLGHHGISGIGSGVVSGGWPAGLEEPRL